jgi:hypothetical protein
VVDHLSGDPVEGLDLGGRQQVDEVAADRLDVWWRRRL